MDLPWVGNKPRNLCNRIGKGVHTYGAPRRDRELLHGMHVNALRSWGHVSRERSDEWFEAGFYWLPQVHRPELALGQFRSGDPSATPVWTAAENLNAIAQVASDLDRSHVGAEYLGVRHDESPGRVEQLPWHAPAPF